MSKDSWNPNQYEIFKEERSQPFFDLLNLLQTQDCDRVVDLGCGTGKLTAELQRYLRTESLVGIDSSEEMLKQAQIFASPGISFEKGDIENWKVPDSYNIIFSNAALQWCSHHPQLFARLRDSLRPNGQIAIQMPMNHDYATHVLANQMSHEEPWISLLKGEPYENQKNLLTPEAYSSLLFKLGFREQNVLLKVYAHQLNSREGVIEWVKGSLLTYFKSRLKDEDYNKFISDFQTRLFQQIPDDQPFFYPFKRVLIWARK